MRDRTKDPRMKDRTKDPQPMSRHSPPHTRSRFLTFCCCLGCRGEPAPTQIRNMFLCFKCQGRTNRSRGLGLGLCVYRTLSWPPFLPRGSVSPLCGWVG